MEKEIKQKNALPKSKKLAKTFAEEIANINNVEGMCNFLKKIVNPDEILRNSSEGWRTLKRLEREPQVAACILSRVAGVTSLNYRLKFDDKNSNRDFYEKLFKNLPILDIIKDILKATRYGYQPIEINWGYKNGYVVPEQIQAKPFQWFFFDTKRQLCFKKKGESDGLAIPFETRKFLCPSNNADYLNPYGEGFLSLVFWDVAFKKGGMEFWVKFAEKYGMPWLIGKYEPHSSNDLIDELLGSMEDMVQDAVAAIPDNCAIEIKEPSGKAASADIYKQLVEICDKNIAKTIIGQTLTTDVGESGSYSLGQVHKKVLDAIVNADKALVEEQFNILLRWINFLNFGTEDEAPEFEIFADEEIDQAKAERDTKLHGMGVRFTKDYMKKAYGFEDTDIEIVSTEPQAFNFSESSKQNSFRSVQKEIDQFINNFSDNDLDNILSEKIKPILEKFMQNRDPQQVLENLSILYPQHSSQMLEETLTKVIFLANLWGRINNDNK